ncbi:hypothetical protein [Salinibacter ruber]|uniref:hypothetical protein n=1 Tax=Salinibacter ruber TaxID=146919 RepID=UPI0011AF5293|nr:hypothetical protein [Salinibacter ruber]
MSLSTIRQDVAAIRWVHERHGAEDPTEGAGVGMLRRMCDNGEEALHFLKNSFGHVRTRGRHRQRENWTKYEPGS